MEHILSNIIHGKIRKEEFEVLRTARYDPLHTTSPYKMEVNPKEYMWLWVESAIHSEYDPGQDLVLGGIHIVPYEPISPQLRKGVIQAYQRLMLKPSYKKKWTQLMNSFGVFDDYAKYVRRL